MGNLGSNGDMKRVWLKSGQGRDCETRPDVFMGAAGRVARAWMVFEVQLGKRARCMVRQMRVTNASGALGVRGL